MLNTGANKSVYVVVAGALLTAAHSLFPDVMPVATWESLQAALMGVVVWLVGNKT